MPELVYLLSAEIDIQSAYEVYEERQEGRGDLFSAGLEAALDRLRAFPRCGPIVLGPIRRLLVIGFPYGIYYTVEARGVIISAVLDTRQDPDAILRRLSE